MCPTSSDEPGSSGSSDISNTNENSLSLGTCLSNHLDQASLHQSSSMTSSQTLYIPIASPPTPSPSPGPITHQSQGNPFPPLTMMKNTQNSRIRRHFLSSVVNSCTPSELLFISQTIGHLLKRDFLYLLPPELSLHILRFIDEPKTLVRASQVSKHWWSIVRDESVWKRMCLVHGFDDWDMEIEMLSQRKNRLPSKSKTALVEEENLNDIDNTSDRRSKRRIAKTDITKHTRDFIFSYRRHFRTSYVIQTNWRKGGTLLRSHRLPIVNPHHGTVTSCALNQEWVVVGFADSKIQVFSARTGVLSRTLVGHESGVWGLCLVSSGGIKLVNTNNKPKVKRRKTLTSSSSSGDGNVVEGFDASSTKNFKKQKKHRKPSTTTTTTTTQDVDASSSSSQKKPSSMRTLRAGVAGIDLRSNLDGSDGMHVMPSESLESLVSPEMRIALGLEASTDSEHGSSGDDSHREEDEAELDSTERQSHARKGGTTTLEEEEDLLGTGVDQGKNPDKPSNMCYASQGWGQPNSLIVSGGCDKVVRVWDVKSGHCIYVLHGHTSTIRSLRVLHNRPIAVSGSRDSTLRVWDIQRGKCLRVLAGHHESVRCLDVCGNRVVSGSYDNTCRLWNIDTGECIFVLQGHFHQIYCVAYDGVKIASGGLDSTVRVWDAETGECLAILLGHSALVCQLQLSPTILATGGSDGRVITFSLETYTALQRIAAHDSSVISLQFDKTFLVTGGNDGRVRLYETETGNFVRELNEPGECVWKVAFVKCTYAIMCKRAGKTVVEIWSLGKPTKKQQRFEEWQKGGDGGALVL